MKRAIVIVALVMGIFVSGAAAIAAAAGTPEVNNANAMIQLKAHGFVTTQCIGEDDVSYVTLRGRWTGTETETTPGLTDYTLTGSLTVSGIVWTINTKTGRGVLTGAITMTDPAAAKPVYAGRLTLITQGMPAAPNGVAARGWIVAHLALPDEGATPGDDNLLANVEFAFDAGLNAKGQFGDAPSANTPDFSVVTNVAPKALDGTC